MLAITWGGSSRAKRSNAAVQDESPAAVEQGNCVLSLESVRGKVVEAGRKCQDMLGSVQDHLIKITSPQCYCHCHGMPNLFVVQLRW